jgi:probable phosphoglycerate mutase
MIYLVRHGQTEFNREGRYQGACDSPLTLLGQRQARAIGVLLRAHTPRDATIVSSPLGRAWSTAEIIRQTGGFSGEVVADPNLAEISMGAWDGLLLSEIEALRPPFDMTERPSDWYMRSPDGETYDAFAARLGVFLAHALRRAAPLIVVSHGVAGRVLRGLYASLDKDEALRLPVPQDAVWRLAGGRIERLDAQAVA